MIAAFRQYIEIEQKIQNNVFRLKEIWPEISDVAWEDVGDDVKGLIAQRVFL
jgi:hypothetical protein